MRKVFVGLLLLVFAATNAQDKDSTSLGRKLKKDAKITGHAIKKGATTVGTKTAEIAAKGESRVVDKVYAGKSGPNGETIYINNSSQYYWVDKKGHRHYLAESELHDKQG